jgi:hypothetical protein
MPVDLRVICSTARDINRKEGAPMTEEQAKLLVPELPGSRVSSFVADFFLSKFFYALQ